MQIYLSDTITLENNIKKTLNIIHKLPQYKGNFKYGYNRFIYICSDYYEASLIDSLYGDAVKIICYNEGKDIDLRLDYYTILCLNLKDLLEYLKPTSIVHRKYMIIGNGLLKYKWHMLLKGWSFVRNSPEVDIFRLEQVLGNDTILYKKTYFTKALIKKPCDIRSVERLRKDKLHLSLPDIVCRTRLLKDVNKINVVSIIKPTGKDAFAGRGITVCSNQAEFEIGCKKIKYNEGIVCDYLVDPLLFQGKKFHVRAHLFISSWNTFSNGPMCLLATAKLPYIQGDWLNPDIHDSHGKTTDNTYFLEDLEFDDETMSIINDNIDYVLNEISKILYGNVVSYTESKKSWNVLGIDIMFDNELVAWLLEVNELPGFILKHNNEKSRKFERIMLEWEYDCIKDQL